jgi:uncharacterized protein (DUF488 family)
MQPPFFTIGHSNRSIDEFVALLREAGVALVVDIRKMSRSKTNPQFNADALPEALGACNIGYEHIAALGGLRPRQKAIEPAENGYWINQSFHNYADYALGPEFQAGLQQLRREGHLRCCAIMCAEALWWQCHRRIVADYLIANGERVVHIMGRGHQEPAHLTSGAIVRADKTILSPAVAQNSD